MEIPPSQSGIFQSYSTRNGHQRVPNTVPHDGKGIASLSILNRQTSSHSIPRDRGGWFSRKLIHPPWLVPEYVWISHESRSMFLNETEVSSVLIPVGGGYCSDIGVDFLFIFLFVVRRGRNGYGKVQCSFDGGACVCSFIPGVWCWVGIFCNACVGLLRIPCISFERNVKFRRQLKRNSQSWQQYYRIGNDMGAYEPTQVAKYSIFCQGVFETIIYKQYTDLFAICHDLGQILRIEIFIRGPLRAREIVN